MSVKQKLCVAQGSNTVRDYVNDDSAYIGVPE